MFGQAIAAESERRGNMTIGAARSAAEIKLNLQRPETLEDAFETVAPDLVINAAALIDIAECEKNPDLAKRVNGEAVSVMAKLCARSNARLIHVSTDHYFTGDGDARHDEQAEIAIVNEYARSKFAGEKAALEYAEALVLRTNIVGFRGWTDRPTFVEWIIGSLRDNRPTTLFDDVYVSSIDVRNAARAMFDLLAKGARGVINLGSRQVFSKGDFIRSLATRLGYTTEKMTSGTGSMLKPQRAESLGLDVTKAEKILGRRLPELDMVVESLSAEYQSQSRC